MKNILITSAGKRVTLTRCFQDSLGSRGTVFCADVNPTMSPACHVVDRCFQLPSVVSSTFKEELLKLCIAEKIKVVIPTIDDELALFADLRAEFFERDIHIVISDQDLIATCRDKRKTSVFFQSKNIPTPKIYNRNSLPLPVFVKPFDGSRSLNATLISDRSGLTPQVLADPSLIFLEAIDTQTFQEITIDLYYNRQSELCSVVPRKRLEVRDGEVNKAITIDCGLVQFTRERLTHLPGARGCINLQIFFNEESQQIKGIEINPRFGGGYPLSHKAGARFTQHIVTEYIDDCPICYSDNWERDLIMLRYHEEVFINY